MDLSENYLNNGCHEGRTIDFAVNVVKDELRVRRTARAHPSQTLALQTLRAVTCPDACLQTAAGDNRTPRFPDKLYTSHPPGKQPINLDHCRFHFSRRSDHSQAGYD